VGATFWNAPHQYLTDKLSTFLSIFGLWQKPQNKPKYLHAEMRVCGFSFVRNAVTFDYPVVEAIRSILPICDGFVVAVGNSEDGTIELIRGIDPRIIIIETVWDENQREGGRTLAMETDKAFQAIQSDFDWAFYIQGDEVVHEKYLPAIQLAMKENLHRIEVDGLLLNYTHFFGSYDFVGLNYSWYRREIRVVRNRKDIFSFKDAQGFRKKPNEKLCAKLIDAHVYHYGWVREPRALQEKERSKVKYYRNDSWIQRFFVQSSHYQYEEKREPLKLFEGTHPAVMRERIARKNWLFQPDLSLKYHNWKDRVKRTVGEATGWYPGEYKNYKLVR
jgi:hypothetical protein